MCAQHPFGALSPYGHELIPLLQSMTANGGEFDEHKYAEVSTGRAAERAARGI